MLLNIISSCYLGSYRYYLQPSSTQSGTARTRIRYLGTAVRCREFGTQVLACAASLAP
eukprot:SAG11_NODE_32818_length_280_cov_1.651934_1_plen_57_part_10